MKKSIFLSAFLCALVITGCGDDSKKNLKKAYSAIDQFYAAAATANMDSLEICYPGFKNLDVKKSDIRCASYEITNTTDLGNGCYEIMISRRKSPNKPDEVFDVLYLEKNAEGAYHIYNSDHFFDNEKWPKALRKMGESIGVLTGEYMFDTDQMKYAKDKLMWEIHDDVYNEYVSFLKSTKMIVRDFGNNFYITFKNVPSKFLGITCYYHIVYSYGRGFSGRGPIGEDDEYYKSMELAKLESKSVSPISISEFWKEYEVTGNECVEFLSTHPDFLEKFPILVGEYDIPEAE